MTKLEDLEEPNKKTAQPPCIIEKRPPKNTSLVKIGCAVVVTPQLYLLHRFPCRGINMLCCPSLRGLDSPSKECVSLQLQVSASTLRCARKGVPTCAGLQNGTCCFFARKFRLGSYVSRLVSRSIYLIKLYQLQFTKQLPCNRFLQPTAG